MRIAIPLAGGKLTNHFGHCERFALIEVDPKEKTILKKDELSAPAHEPGLLPRWLAEHGIQVVIAGGMGGRAQALCADNGITVMLGASTEVAETLVNSYLNGTLQVGENVCDH